ncbi:MAG: hypothetical protein DRH07_05395 [Deltaproteobacteria bacterium]|nr:MAG: hypothetical protein DRH07_05395 [Deltaproteobacteria bacterium]
MQDSSIRLLLVEDDKVDQMAFERFVKRENLPYDYAIAGSVAAAEEVLKSTGFDIIISDYMLGDGTSFELFDLYKNVPVIITTGSGDEGVAVEAMKLGACDYLIKDPEGNYLQTLPITVELALKRKQNETELQNYHERLESMVEERTAELQAEIVERKKAEATIRKSEEQWYRTFNSFTDIVTLQTPDLTIVKANQAAYLTLNLTWNTVIGHHCYELFHGVEEICPNCPLQATVKTFKPYTSEIYHAELDKTFLVSASPIFDEQGDLEYIAHVAKDITEMKQLQGQLQQAQKMEAIGLMAGGMAHNFNNNLAIILGNIELAQIKMPAASDVIEYLKNAKIAVLRSRDIIQQILTFSRKGEKDIVPMQPALVVDETLMLLRSTMPSTVNLQQVISKSSRDVSIKADPSRIQEVLLNLCTNAVHAMEEKGDLTISLEAVLLQPQDLPAQYGGMPGRYVQLSVQDSGSGITEEAQKNIFDPFFTTKDVGKGTGMGLATVYGIVEQHNGMIKVKSIVGEGTTFEVYFPVIEFQQLESGSTIQNLPRGDEKILFLDDDEMITNVWSQMLSEHGYKVSSMTSSTETLKLFTANPDYFDLVITDQTMPDVSGQDLIKELLKIKPKLLTILCTGYSTKIDEDKAKKLGIKAFCMKPLDLAELLEKTRRVLDEAQLPNE